MKKQLWRAQKIQKWPSHFEFRSFQQLQYIKHLKTTKTSWGLLLQLNARRALPVYSILEAESHNKSVKMSLKNSTTIQSKSSWIVKKNSLCWKMTLSSQFSENWMNEWMNEEGDLKWSWRHMAVNKILMMNWKKNEKATNKSAIVLLQLKKWNNPKKIAQFFFETISAKVIKSVKFSNLHQFK